MLRSDLCDYSDAYFFVKEIIIVDGANNDAYDKTLVFKKNAPFTSCISKINNTLIDFAEDLDVFMSMYNLIEYSKKYSKTSGNLWNYYRDEPNSAAEGDINFPLKLKGISRRKMLKLLYHFWRTLHIPLINCEVPLALTWFKMCVIISKATREANPGATPAVVEINNPTGATFKIKDTKLYVPEVTLSTQDDNKL